MIHGSDAARKRAQRAREKAAGYKDVHLALPEEYKTLLDKFCARNNMGQVEALCYLLDLYCDFTDDLPAMNAASTIG